MTEQDALLDGEHSKEREILLWPSTIAVLLG